MKEERFEYLKDMNERIYEQLSFAETKNGVMLGLITAILGVVIGVMIAGITLCTFLKIYFWTIIVTFSFSLIFCLLSFLPNLKTLNVNSKNLYFYGSLAKYNNVEEYENDIQECDDLYKDLEEQNIQVSKIVVRKHKFFLLSINCIFAGVVLPIYFLYIVCFIIHKAKNKK